MWLLIHRGGAEDAEGWYCKPQTNADVRDDFFAKRSAFVRVCLKVLYQATKVIK